MLVENGEQIDDLAQTLGDKEMAINLTTATNEYARDVAAKALAIDNYRDKRDFIVRAMDTMGTNIEKSIVDNNYFNIKFQQEGPEAAAKFANKLREILMQSPGYQAINKMLADMGVSYAGSSSGASSPVITDVGGQYMTTQ